MFKPHSLLAAFLVTASLAQAHTGHSAPPATRPSVKAQGAFIAATPPGAPSGALYLQLSNTGKTPLTLLGGTTSIAAHVMPMKSVRDQKGLIGMQDVSRLIIPAGRTLRFRPGGDHLMLYGLKRAPKVGETVAVTLKFTSGTLRLNVPVKKF